MRKRTQGVKPGFQTLRTASCDIRFHVAGSGPATVLVHGFGGDLHSWDALCALLPEERCVIRHDLRGFGRSTARTDTLFHHADDLVAMLDALKIERCDLVGLSMGGAVSISFALSHPERVRSLALLSTGLTGWERSDAWRALLAPADDRSAGRRHRDGADALARPSNVQKREGHSGIRHVRKRGRPLQRGAVAGGRSGAGAARHRPAACAGVAGVAADRGTRHVRTAPDRRCDRGGGSRCRAP
ncbi:MAG: alpha/beta fold hydrolase [Sphingobium sp.]